MIDISFIIPSYNVEKYITQCLDSICLQQHMGLTFEIIVIDDGSSDRTVKLVSEYTKCSKLSLITQKHCGPGAARNKGIEVASGEWVCFVDSDDLLSNSAFKVFKEAMTSNCAEVVFRNIWFTDGNETPDSDIAEACKIIQLDSETQEKIRTDYFIQGKKIEGMHYCFEVPWAKIYRRGCIVDNQIRFPEKLIFNEDIIFNYLFLSRLANQKHIATCENVVSYIRMNPQSVTKKCRRDIIDRIDDAVYEWKAALKSTSNDTSWIANQTGVRKLYLFTHNLMDLYVFNSECELTWKQKQAFFIGYTSRDSFRDDVSCVSIEDVYPADRKIAKALISGSSIKAFNLIRMRYELSKIKQKVKKFLNGKKS